MQHLLHRCSECGKKRAFIFSYTGTRKPEGLFAPSCLSCGNVTGFYEKYSDAVNAWNLENPQ